MMDTSEYMPMFLAEAREHLQELNLAVVRLEQDASDQATVDDIFRAAHSFKGMSATMGFNAIAELTHTMEDVFELLRQRSGGLETDAIDAVLACLDALEASVDHIESDGSEELDPAPLIERLQTLIRERTPGQEAELAGGQVLPDAETLAAAHADGGHVLHVVVALDDEAQMPAVRAHMVIAALWDRGEVIGSIPAPEQEESFSGRLVEAWLVSDAEKEAIARAVTRISDVATVEIDELGEGEAAISAAAADAGAKPAVESGAGGASSSAAGSDAGPASAAAGSPDAAAGTGSTPGAGQRASDDASGGAPKAHASAHTVRVDAERLDALMHQMGELVIHRTAIEALTHDMGSPELHNAVQNLTRSSQALQSMVMQVRMIPVDVVFMRFPRLVRDLQEKLGKELELDLVGRETELDRSVVDALGDPLMHLVRNSLDHGLEPPEEREAHGKPRVGKLTISARHAGGSVVIEVKDDGHGIDPAVVARKALEKGLIDADTAASLDMRGAIELLFTQGFSTRDTVSELSGRGVGLDVVRSAIRSLGGDVFAESVLGQGTTAQIRLPLTLAIVAALEVDVAGAPFAIPIDHVDRTLTIENQNISNMAGRRMLSLDDGVLPLLDGARVFGLPQKTQDDLIVIVRAGNRRVGLTVNDVVGQRELVTRPMPPRIMDGQPISGGAVLANGTIALIVDCDALVADGERLQNSALTAISASSASSAKAPETIPA